MKAGIKSICVITAGAMVLIAPGRITHAASGVNLTVTIQNIQSTQGQLKLALVRDKDDFPVAVHPAYQGHVLPAKTGSTYVFSNIAPGQYAVVVYHDLNGNEKIDENFLGIPNEPYGISNTPKSRMIPPVFADAALTLNKNSAMVIELKQ